MCLEPHPRGVERVRPVPSLAGRSWRSLSAVRAESAVRGEQNGTEKVRQARTARKLRDEVARAQVDCSWAEHTLVSA